MSKIHGNIKTLFSMHGDINVEKALDAIEYMTELDEINIDEINDASEKGLLYITSKGKLIEFADKACESRAKYKLVPTGLKLRYTNYPLFASFVKIGGFWEGAFIGTGIQLFEMYKEHYGGRKEDYSKEYERVFGGENRTNDIRGFGLVEIEKNNSDDDNQLAYKDEDEDSHVNELTKALEKCKKQMGTTKKGKGAKMNKMQRKAARLEAHLNKIKGNQTKQINKPIIKKAPLKDRYNSADEVVWMTVYEIGDINILFEDKATLDLQKRIAEGFNIEECNAITEDIKQKLIDDETKIEYEDTKDIEAVVTPECENNIIEEENDTETDTDEHIDVLGEPVIYVESDDTTEAIVSSDTAESELIVGVVSNTTYVDKETNTKEEEESSDMDDEIIKSMDHDSAEYTKAESSRYKSQLKADFICDVYERLLLKENWKFKDKNRLGFYLKGIFILVDTNRKHNKGVTKGNGYILSKDKTKQVVNSGLIDVYGNDIMIVDHTPQVQDFYSKKLVVLPNKATLIDWGFDVKDIRKLPSPVKLVNNPSEYIFRGTLDDIDLNDEYHLKHIIEERRSRFPAKYKNTPVKEISDRLKIAVTQAVRMSKTDYKYILPKYDFGRNNIQFMIPFYLDAKLGDIPELVIVIGNYGGMWQIYTVLHTDDAYDDARLICKPTSDWLRLK